MSSVDNHYRQRQPSYFMPVSSLQGLVYAYNGSAFTNATWASTGSAFAVGGSPYLSSINGAGAGILKDLGKQVVSSSRVFRKVQLVVRNGAPTGTQNTFGVAGAANTSPNQDYLTGYIELGYDGNGPATPVVNYGAQ